MRPAFVALERQRHELVFRASRFWRGSRRYEDLLLAGAVGRLQRCCITETTESEAGQVERVLLASLKRDVLRHDSAAQTARQRLSDVARSKAEARARKRFEAIVTAVEVGFQEEQISAMLIPSRRSVADRPSAPPSPRRAPSGAKRELSAAPASEAWRCAALTRRGTRCKNEPATGGLCKLHAQLAAEPVYAAPPEQTSNGSARRRVKPWGDITDTAWAVGVFVVLAAVLTWIGLPLGEDAPVGSRVVVGQDSTPPATGQGGESLVAQPHRSRAGDASGDDRTGGRRGDLQRRDSVDGGAVTSVSPSGVPVATALTSDPAPVAPPPDQDPAQDPAPATDDTSNGGAGGDPPATGGDGGQAQAVRGELVDEMLGVPGR
jgi:hypothetical protein